MKKIITLILVAVLMISFAVVANAAVGTVVYGYKTDKAPNMEEIDESWGEPVAYITKDSPNAELAKYWTEANDTCNYQFPEGTGPNGRTTIVPEDSDFWLYILYDKKYIYLAFKSPDYEICGSEEKHRGDGIHLWLQPLADMADPYGSSCGRAVTSEYDSDGLTDLYYYFWNLAFDDYSVDKGNASVNLDENPCINFYDDMMHATIAIPLSNYGLRNKDLHGFEFGTCVLRCSSKSTFDEGYAGWLNWGQWMSSYTTKTKGVNTIVLVDPAQGDVNVNVDTEPVVTEPVVTEPVATEPVVTEPVVTEPVATEPVATEPVATEPVATEPVVTEPVATEPVVTEPVATEPVVTEPVAPETPAEIMDEAYSLEDGATLPYEATLTGVINAINTEWSEQYGNITVTMTVEGKDMMCYRLKGDGAKDLAIGDTITVTGTIKNYKGTIEFDAGCILNAVIKAEAPETEPAATDAPETEAPVVETEAPVVETEAPATEAPKAEEPAEKNNTGLIIAIVAAVVVVGAVVGIVLGKKKK